MLLGLVADDLTGACDAAVQFARRGWDTQVYFAAGAAPARDTSAAPSNRVVAVTCDSRALDNASAERVTREALARLMDAGIERVFLKIDSTGRGSVPGQIAGALAAWSGRYSEARAVVCPAYPSMGRTVRANHLFVNGVPVEQSAAGRDPVTPVATSDMAKLIPASPRVTTADASSDDDLRAIAASVADAGPSTIAVGSGGLAGAVAERLAGAADSLSPIDAAPNVWRKASRILLLVSSLNPASHAQVARLLQKFPDIIVLLAPTGRVEGSSVAESLAERLATLVEQESWDVVGLIGGDGARAALRRLNATAVRVVDAVLEGIPLGTLVGGPADGMTVFTKAGGFGDQDALVKVIERMRA